MINNDKDEQKIIDRLKWEPVKVEHLVQDKWIDFRKVRYRFPDGTEFEPYYNYSRKNYVVIVASDTDGNFLCVRQYRHGIREVTTEFPAGGIETVGGEYDSDKAVESALDAAKRELKEETGYESDEWSHIITVPSNATLADNYGYIFHAVNCRQTSDQHLDSTEFLIMEKKTAEEIDELIQTGRFQQAIHIMAWLMVKNRN